MPANKNKTPEKTNHNSSMGECVKDRYDDPFVLKQVAAATEVLNRPGVQEQLKKIAKKYEEKA